MCECAVVCKNRFGSYFISTYVGIQSGRGGEVDAPLIGGRLSSTVSREQLDGGAEGRQESTGGDASGEPDGSGTDRPDRPPVSGVLEALSVPKHARRGVIAGALLATGMYLIRVLELLGPTSSAREYPILGPEGWFVLLAFVLAVAVALSLTILLTVAEAVRMATRPE